MKKILSLLVLSLVSGWTGSPFELQIQPTGEVKVLKEGQTLGVSQIFLGLSDPERGEEVTYGQSASHKTFEGVEVSQEGDEHFITGTVPGAGTLLQRITVGERSVRFTISFRFEADVDAKIYTNYSLYGLEPPLSQVRVEDEGGAAIFLSDDPNATTSENKLLTNQSRVSVFPSGSAAYEVQASAPIFLSDARLGGGFFYLGIMPEQSGSFAKGDTVNYSYEVTLLAP